MNNQTDETKVKAKVKTNMERFMASTGKTEEDYKEWASSVGRQMHINTLDKLICATNNVYAVSHLGFQRTEISEYLDEKETTDFLIEHSTNPYELAMIWSQTRLEAYNYVDRFSIIDMFLSQFPKENFERFGDKNWLPDVSRSWFKKDGVPLDTQLQEMSSVSGIDIEMDDIIEFVRTYRRNTYLNPAQILLKKIEQRWKELTTFSLKDYYVEHLIKANTYAPAVEEIEVPF